MPKLRLDQLVVQCGLAESREKAQRLIRAGRVRVEGRPEQKPGHLFDAECRLELTEQERFVSRGGEKLLGAIETFGLQLDGLTALDIGASTGGFTDCMLQHGVWKVYAVDVGRGQLHWKLRNDPRVTVIEGVNARYLTPEQIPGLVDFVGIDTSFISLTRILPPLKALVRPGGRIVSLIKPQFEAGREQVGRGGVVRDPAVHEAVIAKVRDFGTTALGFRWLDCCPSPIKGPAGNVEFLALWETA
jgi:23S rRNA (cytidine1920-2'-O)/16S rRNA (cytidine1409-2'-O)-methyltransferase